MVAAPPAEIAVLARLDHAVLAAFVDEGGAPHYTELARRLVLPLEETRLALHRLASLKLPIWLHPSTDLLTTRAPFSNLPTQYLITVDSERRWHGRFGLVMNPSRLPAANVAAIVREPAPVLAQPVSYTMPP